MDQTLLPHIFMFLQLSHVDFFPNKLDCKSIDETAVSVFSSPGLVNKTQDL